MSFHSHPINWIGVTNRKRSNQSQIVRFSPHWKRIGHLFYATSNSVHHFVAICEFQLELYSGKAQSGAKFALASVAFTFDPWPLTCTTLLSMATTPESENGVTGGRTEMTQNYDRHRHLNLVNSFILSCNLLCGHVGNVLGRCLLCMDAWHFINKTFSSIYIIKFPDLSLKYLSDSDIHIERTKTTSMEKGV